MIILATVIIISLTNNNIIDKANTAVNDTNLKNMEEAANIALGEVILENDGSIEGVDDIESKIKTKMEANGIDTRGYNISYNNGTGKLTVSIGSNEALYTFDLSENKNNSVVAKVYSDKIVISGTGKMYDVHCVDDYNQDYAFSEGSNKLNLRSHIVKAFFEKYNNGNLPSDFYILNEYYNGYVEINDLYTYFVYNEEQYNDVSLSEFQEYVDNEDSDIYEMWQELTNVQKADVFDSNIKGNFNEPKAMIKMYYYAGQIPQEVYTEIENIMDFSITAAFLKAANYLGFFSEFVEQPSDISFENDIEPMIEHLNELKGITKLEIENGITHIGSGMFNDMPFEGTITIPNSVTSIGAGAFDDCFRRYHYHDITLLDNDITIPSSVTSVGRYAIEGHNVKVSWNEGEKPANWDNDWYRFYSNITYGYTGT